MGPRPKGIPARFWPKVDKTGPVPSHAPHLGPCWLWTGTSSDGYGRLNVGGRKALAHRLAYELLVGPIPEGMTLDHLCRVRHCVNPAHLEPVTNRENQLRGNGLGGVNARKTHCNQGHPFDATNTYWHGGTRHCRACNKRAVVAYQRRQAVAS